jgi:hypothetical protein
MSTASQLAEQGIEKMRLPNWNEHAYLYVPSDGPWAKLYDVLAGIGGGQPIPILLIDADRHDNWVPVSQ